MLNRTVAPREEVHRIVIGTAGWSIPRALQGRLPGVGTHLHRYASTLGGAEINTSFYRSHTVSTYTRWAASTPQDFRFAVKVPREITHERQLQRPRLPLVKFLEETDALAARRGPLLVQLPPSLALDERSAHNFFEVLRSVYEGPVVCEPRHQTWFSSGAGGLLEQYRVARVGADPPPAAGADEPGGWPDLVYLRLHGSPRKYWSSYDDGYLTVLATSLSRIAASADVWCVFDNTASGAALANALDLSELVSAATPN